MPKSTFVFVPGAWHTPSAFGGVMAALLTHGYLSVGVSLPSVGAVPAVNDVTEDIFAIREVVIKLVEQGEEVIVVLHSYGGIPGSQALEGLGKKERERAGDVGGVVRLVYIAAYVLPAGFQLASRGDVTQFSKWVRSDIENGISIVEPADAKETFYNDVSDTVAEKYIAQLKNQSIGVFWGKTIHAAWRRIPSTCILCENDQALPLQFAESMLKTATEIEPKAFDVVERCQTGHSPFISQEKWTVDVLKKAAGEIV